MTRPTPPKIGIMADSHGDPEAITKGALFLKQQGCGTLYHLGDICDTNRQDTADECVARVRNHGIIAVKGNNDHSLAADARGRMNGGIHPKTLTFLENLPLHITVEDARLVHSRPFTRRLGLSAMIGTVGKKEARAYFKENPTGLLFRGHSHQPELICLHDDTIRFTSLQDKQVLDLRICRPCIITCGAVCESTAMIWEPIDARLSTCSFS